MINYNDIEKRLEAVLDNETHDSLLSFLLSQRSTNIESFLGDGNLYSVGLIHDIFLIDTTPKENMNFETMDNFSFNPNDSHILAA